jgi:hypothetical protein
VEDEVKKKSDDFHAAGLSSASEHRIMNKTLQGLQRD